MPRDATTGVYTRVSNSFSEPILGEVIDPTDADELFDDQTDALNTLPAQLGTYTATGTGAVERTIAARLNDFITVKDYGAVGDGVTDDTAAITAADVAAAALNARLVFPGGLYKVSSALTPSSGAYWEGTSNTRAFIITNSATANVLNLTNSLVTIDNIQINSFVSRTAGSYYNINAANITLINSYGAMVGTGTVLTLGSSTNSLLIDGGIFGGPATGGGTMIVNGALNCMMRNVVFVPNATITDYHISLINSGDIFFVDCHILGATTGVIMQPGTGQGVSSIHFIGGYLDGQASTGLLVQPSGIGAVARCSFTDMAFTSAGVIGVHISPQNTSAVSGLSFIGCDASICATGFSATAGTGSIDGLTITNSHFSGDGTGAEFDGVTHLCLTNNTFGASGGSGNTITGATFTGTMTGSLVSDNLFDVTGTAVTTTATGISFGSNPGYNAVSFTASGGVGRLPFANIAQGSALSVLGVAGNAIADNASVAAASDNQIMRRLGTAIAFGSIDLSQSNAVGSSILAGANGGTGVANTSKTITLGGNFTTSGAFAATFTLTNTTTVTFPTTGTLATLAGAEEFTNKTLNASVGKGTWTTSGTWTLPALTLGGAITYGGVTLSNAVTGTGNMVLSASPTFTGTLNAAAVTATGTATAALIAASALGASGTPVHSFSGDPDTGMWSPAANQLAFSTGGSVPLSMNATGIGVGVNITGIDSPLYVGGTPAGQSILSHFASSSGAMVQFTDSGAKDWAFGVADGSTSLTFYEDRNAAAAGTLRLELKAAGQVSIPGTVAVATDRWATLTNQTSAAAAQVGTLTNAPAAGNPGFWLKITINGTNYSIPCWLG